MTWLVLGATGLLGPAVVKAIRARNERVITAARKKADMNFDISDVAALSDALRECNPTAVFNCAALADLAGCETDPLGAYGANARPLSVLAAWSKTVKKPFVHVSTDCFFRGEGDALHDEHAPVTLLHEYARTKFAGEAFALTAPRGLVLRTNLLGAKKGFARFVLDSLREKKPASFFTDFYTSPLHIDAFAAAALDLAQKKATGLVNLGARGAASKADLARGLALRAGLDFSKAQLGSVAALSPRRAESLGLDVRKAENLLGYALPSWEQSLDSVLAEGA
ncbi:MAG: sugar nucleotide-binding protein [Caulobacterales bacterium]